MECLDSSSEHFRSACNGRDVAIIRKSIVGSVEEGEKSIAISFEGHCSFYVPSFKYKEACYLLDHHASFTDSFGGTSRADKTHASFR